MRIFNRHRDIWGNGRSVTAGHMAAVAVGGDNAGLIVTNVNLGIVSPVDVPQLHGYLERARDLGPGGPLINRENELRELFEFCWGSTQYVLWEGEPCAGKTALLSSFVLDPPPTVDIVSFFITSRLPGQSNSEAFTDALLEQLAVLAENPVPLPAAGRTVRDARRRSLLAAAAERAASIGRDLVLVIDGLDEDTGAVPSSGVSSIAALLPTRLPANVRVIVSRRAGIKLPADVPHGHPLRSCQIRTLEPSPHAQAIAERAKAELTEILTGLTEGRDVVGLLAATGGGLSITDLEELTGRPPFELERILGGVVRRTIRPAEKPGGGPVETFVFAHETLQVAARQSFGKTLQAYGEIVNRWAEAYESRGWPPDTPTFLMQDYVHFVRDSGDLSRLVKLTTDRARHGRMRTAVGGDAAAMTELRIAQSTVLGLEQPDVESMLRLAVHRDRLAARNTHLPPLLPSVWALLGHVDRAESLARGIHDEVARATALAAIAASLLSNDPHDTRALGFAREAEQVARGRPWGRENILRALAKFAVEQKDTTRSEAYEEEAQDAQATRTMSIAHPRTEDEKAAEAAAQRGDFDEAERLIADTLTAGFTRDFAIEDIVDVAMEKGAFDWAQRFARRIDAASIAGRALDNLVGALIQAGHVSEAAHLAPEIASVEHRIQALTSIAAAYVAQAKPEEARDRARVAESLIAGLRPDVRGAALSALAEAVSFVDRGLLAHRLATAIAEPAVRAEALTRIATKLAATDLRPSALELLVEAETLSGEVVNSGEHALIVSSLLAALGSAGRWKVAQDLADAFAGSPLRESYHSAAVPVQNIITTLARNATESGRYDLALSVAQKLSHGNEALLVFNVAAASGGLAWALSSIETMEQHKRPDALAQIVSGLISSGDTAAAETVVASSNLRFKLTSSKIKIAAAHLSKGSPDRAFAILHELAESALTGRARTSQPERLLELAPLIAECGHLEMALDIFDKARSGSSERLGPALGPKAEERERQLRQSREHATLATIQARAGKIGSALLTSNTIQDEHWHNIALDGIARAAGSRREWDQAVETTNHINDTFARVRALSAIVRSMIEAQELERAARVILRIPTAEQRAEWSIAVAQAAQEAGRERLEQNVDVAELAEAAAASLPAIMNRRAADRLTVQTCRVVAVAGNIDGAVRMASLAKDPEVRATALSSIAEICDPSFRESLLVRALTIGHWAAAMHGLAFANPDLLATTATEYAIIYGAQPQDQDS